MSKKCELTGKSPLKGHKVSHANNKTKRKFFPNLKKVTFKNTINDQESLFSELDIRLRKIQDFPNGIIYLLTDGPKGKLIKVLPSK